MKKVIAILVAVVLILAFAGCSDTTTDTSSDDTADTSTEDVAEESDDTADEDVAEESEDTTSEDAEGEETAVNTTAFDEYTRPRVEETLTIGFLSGVSAAEAHQRARTQAQLECENRGWEYILAEYSDDEDCVTVLNNLIAQDVDAIVLHSITSVESKIAIFEAAREAGIGVYSLDSGMTDGLIMNVCAANGVASLQLFYQIGADTNWDAGFVTLYLGIVPAHMERIAPIWSIMNDTTVYPNMEILADGDLADYLPSPQTQEFVYEQTWIQQFGDDLDVFFCGSDGMLSSVVETCNTLGITSDEVMAVGFDGSSQTFAYLRQEGSVVKYIYAQPFELYTHTVFEAIDAIQVQGLNPGDEGCPLTVAGETIFIDGTIVGRDSVPEVGSTYHEAFSYYDATATDAWYMWDGALTITDGTEE